MCILTGQDLVSHDLVKTRQSPPIASVIIDILAAVEHESASLRSGAGDSQYWSRSGSRIPSNEPGQEEQLFPALQRLFTDENEVLAISLLICVHQSEAKDRRLLLLAGQKAKLPGADISLDPDQRAGSQ